MNTANTFLHFQLRSQARGGPINIEFSAPFLSVCMYKTIRERFKYSPEYVYSLEV